MALVTALISAVSVRDATGPGGWVAGLSQALGRAGHRLAVVALPRRIDLITPAVMNEALQPAAHRILAPSSATGWELAVMARAAREPGTNHLTTSPWHRPGHPEQIHSAFARLGIPHEAPTSQTAVVAAIAAAMGLEDDGYGVRAGPGWRRRPPHAPFLTPGAPVSADTVGAEIGAGRFAPLAREPDVQAILDELAATALDPWIAGEDQDEDALPPRGLERRRAVNVLQALFVHPETVHTHWDDLVRIATHPSGAPRPGREADRDRLAIGMGHWLAAHGTDDLWQGEQAVASAALVEHLHRIVGAPDLGTALTGLLDGGGRIRRDPTRVPMYAGGALVALACRAQRHLPAPGIAASLREVLAWLDTSRPARAARAMRLARGETPSGGLMTLNEERAWRSGVSLRSAHWATPACQTLVVAPEMAAILHGDLDLPPLHHDQGTNWVQVAASTDALLCLVQSLGGCPQAVTFLSDPQVLPRHAWTNLELREALGVIVSAHPPQSPMEEQHWEEILRSVTSTRLADVLLGSIASWSAIPVRLQAPVAALAHRLEMPPGAIAFLLAAMSAPADADTRLHAQLLAPLRQGYGNQGMPYHADMARAVGRAGRLVDAPSRRQATP